jgi:conjugative relaxase-like TrwC/TraI family protein
VAGREAYYVQEIAHDRAEYYTGHGEAAGRWYGATAASMGLRGTAADGTDRGNDPFLGVYYGKDPRTGQLLGRTHRTDGVHAFDLVFRPVKSVGVLYGLGSPGVAAKVWEAQHAGIEAALAYLDGQVSARRGHNGLEHVTGGGLLAVGFDHRQSRAGDPLPHTHLIVANRVQGPDGRWTALDGRDLYAHAMAAQAIHRAVVQRELTRTMGIEWTAPDAHGNREIAGIDEDVLRHFSKRRTAIEARLAERDAQGLSTSARAADVVAHQTRQGKEHGVDERTLRQRWADDLDTLPAALAAGTRAVVEQAHRGLFAPRRALRVDAAEAAGAFDVLAGPGGLTEQASTFARQDVLAALGGQLATVSPAELEHLVDRFLEDRAVPVAMDPRRHAAGSGGRRWSTPELLATEQQMVVAAVGRAAEGRAVVAPWVIDEAIDRSARAGIHLGEDQAAMVRGVLNDGQGVSVVIGRAGTGKTTAADTARAGFEAAGYRLIGLAPTGTAARLLNRDTGIDSSTVDRWLLEARNGHAELDERTVLLVDEAGMLGTRKLLPVLGHAERAGAKVVLIGDDKQLQSIDAGGGFRALVNRLGAYELTVNRRQRDPLDQEAVELIRLGRGDEAMQLYSDGGRVHVAETLAECDRAMVDAWWQAYDSGSHAGMFDHRRADVDRLNDLARERMAAAGRLGPDAMTIGDREFRVGDWVVCGSNAQGRRYASLDVANGTRGYVTALDPARGELRIRTDEGEHARDVLLPAWYLARRPDSNRRVLDHAYATTGHRTQGATYDRGFARTGAHADQEWSYTVATRPKQRMDFFAVGHAREADAAQDLDLPPGPRELATEPEYQPADVVARTITTSRAQRLALDARELGPDPRTLTTRALREEAEQLEQGSLAGRPRSRQVEASKVSADLGDAGTAHRAAQSQRAELEDQINGLGRFGGKAQRRLLERELVKARAAEQLAQQRLEQLAARDREVGAHERRRAVWDDAHAPELARHQATRRELAWRGRQAGRAAEAEMPQPIVDFLGPQPTSVRGRRRWRQLAGDVTEYRQRYGIDDPVRALGRDPGAAELGQRQARRKLLGQAERLWAAGRAHHDSQLRPPAMPTGIRRRAADRERAG